MTWPQQRRCECTYRGEVVRLTSRERDVLVPLLMSRGRVVGRWDIFEGVWDTEEEDDSINDKIVDVYIFKLRKKLPGLIENVRGRGYIIARHDGFAPMRPSEYAMTEAQRLAAALK